MNFPKDKPKLQNSRLALVIDVYSTWYDTHTDTQEEVQWMEHLKERMERFCNLPSCTAAFYASISPALEEDPTFRSHFSDCCRTVERKPQTELCLSSQNLPGRSSAEYPENQLSIRAEDNRPMDPWFDFVEENSYICTHGRNQNPSQPANPTFTFP